MSLRFSEEDYAAYQAKKGQREIPPPKPYKPVTTYIPTEEQEQNTLAQFLDLLGFHWMHTPNEGKRNVVAGGRLKRGGMKKGFPDCLIFNRPPGSDYVGVAIELKRTKGGKLSDEQREWLDNLSECGWLTRCCKGADEAMKFIREVFGV